MIIAMKVRSVALAFVSSVYLVALGANFGSALATTNPIAAEAYQALAAGDNVKAISLYTFAIETRSLEPELLANALLNRALAYQQQNQNAKAVDDYSAALSLDAMSAQLRATALYNRGLSHQRLGKGPLAIEDYTSALMLNPSFSHAFLSRANVLRESGQYLFALSDYERALKYGHPEPARVYFGEAQTYELLNRKSDMRQMLDSALLADSSFKPALEKLQVLKVEQSTSQAEPTAELASADQISTGSIVPVGGTTIMHKPDLPKAIEPPEELLASPDAGNSVTVAQNVSPADGNTQKLYLDRLPPVEEPVFSSSAATEVQAGKTIALAEVPAIPKKQNTKPVLETAAANQELVDNSIETASITPAVETPVTKSAPAGWGVQIASASTEEAAWTTWKNMQKRFKILGDKSPVVVRADLGTKGIFYRVRLTGFDDQNGAKSECKALKTRGVSCFVSKSGGAT
jgi:tetratricopeptide (TPR) repeat protein